jgi:DNA-binding NarL/FixJ family response regulator
MEAGISAVSTGTRVEPCRQRDLADLTPRQREVASLLRAGFTTKQVCARLAISRRRMRQLVDEIAERWSLAADRDKRLQIAVTTALAA